MCEVRDCAKWRSVDDRDCARWRSRWRYVMYTRWRSVEVHDCTRCRSTEMNDCEVVVYGSS